MKTKQNIMQSIDLKTVKSIRSTKTPMNNSIRNSNQKNTHNHNHQNQQQRNYVDGGDSDDDDDDDNNSHVYNNKSKQMNKKSKQNNTHRNAIRDFNHHHHDHNDHYDDDDHQNSHHKKPRTYHRMSLPIEAYPSNSSSMLQLNRQYHHKLFGSTFFDGFSFVISGTKSEEFK